MEQMQSPEDILQAAKINLNKHITVIYVSLFSLLFFNRICLVKAHLDYFQFLIPCFSNGLCLVLLGSTYH